MAESHTKGAALRPGDLSPIRRSGYAMIDLKPYIGKAKFYFLRHGESVGNVARVPQGRADLPLSSKGRRQSRVAASWFADREIDLILSSPLLRACETAEIIAREANLGPVQVWEELNEVDIGPFSGLAWDEIGERYPEMKRRFLAHSLDGVEGAETSEELYKRAEQAWHLVLDQLEHGARNILSVTHSGLIQWLIKTTLGNRTWLPLFPMENCSVYVLSLDNRTIPADAAGEQETQSYYAAWKYIDLAVRPPASPERR